MKIAAALLCDAANVRDGLVNILSAGVTNVYRNAYPAPLGVTLVCIIEIPRSEIQQTGKVTVSVRLTDEPEHDAIVRIVGSIESQVEPDSDERLPGHLPVIASFDQVTLPKPGYYHVEVELDGVEVRNLPFRANLRELPPEVPK